ncbi:MAG: alpha/beta fold hydrolase [Chitinophagales bacterium]|nr:alpha/beta fold hydrolase [Chitinophagales bacterium]
MKLELNYHASVQATSKAPLLFIHGMAHAAWCWEWKFVPFFNQAGYDCYTLSLRGHGKSEGHEKIRWHSINDYLQDVKSAIKLINSTPILIGHSMGGFIIQKYLLEGKEAPAAITLSAVPARGMLKGSLKIAANFPWQFLKGNLTMSTAPFSESEDIVRTIAFSDDVDKSLLKKVKENMEPESYRAYLDMLLLNLHKPAYVNTPLLFLYAENDFIVDYEGWKQTADGFGAEQQVIPNICHDMFLDTYWETVASTIKHWLSQKNL